MRSFTTHFSVSFICWESDTPTGSLQEFRASYEKPQHFCYLEIVLAAAGVAAMMTQTPVKHKLYVVVSLADFLQFWDTARQKLKVTQQTDTTSTENFLLNF